MRTSTLFRVAVMALLVSGAIVRPLAAAQPNDGRPSAQLQQPSTDVLAYIRNTWHTLTRSTNECSSLTDSKLLRGAEAVLYLPYGMTAPESVRKMQTECNVRLEQLPKSVSHLSELPPGSIKQQGLLYLPNSYVVPGGRFNEMYGWDSYFIIRGLLEDGERDLARGMVENFFFEMEHYGAVLNANRTYYLTRSQPPFLTSMILAVYTADRNAGRNDRAWLERAYTWAKRDHELWMREPNLDANTGLSRYLDFGDGPVSEIGDHPEYYESVADWLVKHPEVETNYLTRKASEASGPEFQVPRCGSTACPNSKRVWLTPDFYKGDRAVRESGFDISFRFGPFSGSTHHYAPVCLNSLLYKAETDLERIAIDLNHRDEARQWHQRAANRKRLVTRYLWSADRGTFADYDFQSRTQSSYQYATVFYPLWVGLATQAQARGVMRQLSVFEQAGGLAMSDRETGLQWDKPFGWAPIQMLAVEGMRRYSFDQDADRVSRKFLTMVKQNAVRDGTIREKYDVITRSTTTQVTAGYKMNVVGFGWTNGAFLVLLHQMKPDDQQVIVDNGIAPAVSAVIRAGERTVLEKSYAGN